MSKKKQFKLKDDAIKIAKLFNHDPVEVYAFADDANMPEDIEPVYEEIPMEEEIKAEAEAGGVDVKIDEIIRKLKAIADKEDVKEDVKKQANELIARLEDLKTAVKNAEDFIAENEVIPAETAGAGETAKAAELPEFPKK